MVTQADLDEDERERQAFRKANGVPEPKGPGHRPPLRKTPRGASYRQGRPHVPPPAAPAAAPAPEPAQATDVPAPDQGSGPEPLRGGSGSPSRGPRIDAGKIGHGAAGLVVGLFAWGFALNYVRGGWPQAAGWFGAKFFNEPFGAKAAAASSATSTTNKAAQAAKNQGRANPQSVQSRF